MVMVEGGRVGDWGWGDAYPVGPLPFPQHRSNLTGWACQSYLYITTIYDSFNLIFIPFNNLPFHF